MRIDIITIFPEVCEPYLNASILKRAVQKKLVDFKVHNLRDYSPDKKRKKVDDSPYGGGPGMVMMVEPFDKAISKIKNPKSKIKNKMRVILTSASGKKFTQKDAKRLEKYDQLIFLCGHYEGVDYRVEKYLADESFCIGEFVLTGGELPALVMTDAVVRMIPGVLGKAESLEMESHEHEGVLEHPQYTRPEVYVIKKSKIKNTVSKAKVPKVLLSGNHKKISEWRKEHSKRR